MAEKRDWDLTSNNSLRGAADWLRKKSSAVCVIVLRSEDIAVAADPEIRPTLVQQLLEKNTYELAKRVGDDYVDHYRAMEAKRKKGEQRGR